MIVRATGKYEEKGVPDNELGRIPKAGEQWEISEERYEVLTKTNRFNEVFVEKVIVEDEVEIQEENIIDGKELKEDEVIEVKAKKVNITKKKSTRKKKD